MSQHFTKLTLLLATFLIDPSLAIATETVKPHTATLSQKTATIQVKQRPDQLTILPLAVQPIVFLPNFPSLPADMTGWSARTSGPTKGGGVFVKGEGRKLLIARGGDDNLYAAPLDPLEKNIVPSSNWVSLNQKSNSEPYCSSHSKPPSFTGFVCTFLGDKGNAMFSVFYDDSKLNLHDYYGTRDMGGKNAGAAPTVLGYPRHLDGTAGISYQFAVWDGNSALFTRTAGWFQQAVPGQSYSGPSTEWRKLNTTFTSAPGCAEGSGLCASHDGKRAVIMILKGDGTEPEIKAQSPNLDGISGKPTLVSLTGMKYALVVRGPKGLVHQIVYDANTNTFAGGWKSEGGFITEKSSPHCMAINTQPICVIQGGDGRLYTKALATPSGL